MTVHGILSRQQHGRSLAIPIVIAEEPLASQSPGSLDAIDEIQQPGPFGDTGVTIDREIAAQPGDSPLQGDVRIKNLISIKNSGSVHGNVKYGRLAMEEGADLTAQVRNVPPTLAGDLDIAVDKGRSVRITLDDLNAVDPDDKPENLIFTVSNTANGFVALAAAPATPVVNFTQADLEGGRVVFAHDGTNTQTANFDVIVADHAGAMSGGPQTVKVAVRA